MTAPASGSEYVAPSLAQRRRATATYTLACWLATACLPGAARAADAELADLEARVDALQSELSALSSSAPSRQELGLAFHGFANVDYVHDTLHAEDRKDGFALGNFDMYMLPTLGPRLRGLVELNFEYEEDGQLATDLERLEFGYTFNDALTLWAGRFHTPYGYWNAAFHHGMQITTSTMRPVFLEFEDAGGILPAHSVGLQASGHWRAGAGKLGYDLFISNGDDIVDGVLAFNAVKDSNSTKMFGLNLHYTFDGVLDGLRAGLHGYRDEVGTYVNGVMQSSTRVNMSGAYFVYEPGRWQAMGEYYHFADSDQLQGGGTHDSSAWYLQAAYSIGAVTPFARYENTDLDQSDPYFADQDAGRSYERQALGVRYDLNNQVALKAEWYHTKDVLASWDGARLQLAASF